MSSAVIIPDDVRAEDERLAKERQKIVRDGPKLKGAKLEARLDKTWRRPRGFLGWMATVDHKEIGRRYIVTALIFLALGGVLALLMRLQLAQPDSDLISAQRYNELFTMHGTTMMFLFAVPVMEGVAVFIIPLMLGTRSTAFPRLNAFSYFMYLFGGLLLWVAFALNIAPDIGWFSYTPLSGPQFSPGKRADIWAQMVTSRRSPHSPQPSCWSAHPQDPRAGNDACANAAVRLDDAGGRADDHLLDAVGRACFLDVDFRPADRDSILQSFRTWRRIAVAAPVLVLRAPGGVHHLPARDGLRQHDRRDLLPAPGVRLSGRRAGGDLDRNPRLRIVGPPHVRDRPAACRLQLLHRGKHDRRDPDGAPDLLLAGDDVGWPAALPGADALRDRLHRHLRDRRPDGSHHRVRSARSSASRHLLHRRAFPLCADRRRGLPAARHPHLLVSRSSPAG